MGRGRQGFLLPDVASEVEELKVSVVAHGRSVETLRGMAVEAEARGAVGLADFYDSEARWHSACAFREAQAISSLIEVWSW